jgi:carbamoyl-phosphate synthase small subunit
MPTRPSFRPLVEGWSDEESSLPLVVALDYGVKWSILRRLLERPIRLLLLPHSTSASELKGYGAAGLLLSNGPGDPGRMDAETAVVRELVGELPIFGICLGHQLLCRALGASTYKLAFGHRGPNQPAGLRGEGRIEITSQNHGYAVQWDNIPEAVQVTQRNLNDETIEAVAMPGLRAFSVQHHPEAGPGPHDALGAFATFHGAIGGA